MRPIFSLIFLIIIATTCSQVSGIEITKYTENIIGSGTDLEGVYDFQYIDFDGDGDLDVISVAYVSDEINWWNNSGDNLTFSAVLIQDNANTDGLRSLFVIDFDGDNDYDIIYSAGRENRIAWLENDGTNSSFTDRQICESPATCDDPWSAEVVDMNGDGFYDIVFAENDDDAIQVWINDADGTNLSFSQSTILSGANLDQVEDIKIIDFDGDGDLDVVYAAAAENRLGIARNDGVYPFTDVQVCEGATVCDRVRDVEVVDFDGDGFLDIVSASVDDDQLFWYENDGTNASFSRNLVGSGAAQLDGAKDTEVADFDFDGDYDIIVANNRPGQPDGRLAWWNNSGDNTTFTEVLINDTSVTDGAWRVETVDFDGDGDYDIILASEDADRLSWWETESEGENNTYVIVVADKSSYEVGETVNINTSTSTFLGSPLNSNITTDIINGNTSKPWWNTSYSNRMPIIITGGSGELTDYQVNLSLDTQTLISDGKMQDDCDDMRFAWLNSSNYSQELGYWIEDGCNTSSTRLWIKIPSIPANENITIHMYYNNSGASQGSNGSATFIFFDDFDTWTGWTNYSSGGVNLYNYGGDQVLWKNGNCDPNGGYKTFTPTVTNYRMLVKERRDNEGSCSADRYGIEDGSWNGYNIRRTAICTGSCAFGFERRTSATGGSYQTSDLYQPYINWYITELHKNGSSFRSFLYDVNRSLTGVVSGTDATFGGPFDRVTIRGGLPYYVAWFAIAEIGPYLQVFNQSEQLLLTSNSSTAGSSGYWNWEWDSSIGEIGNYSLVSLANSSGFVSGYARSQISLIPPVPPEVSLITPSNGAILTGSVNVNATVIDGTGVSWANAIFSNTSFSTTYNLSLYEGTTKNGNWSNWTINTSNMNDGYYNITINASDLVGLYNVTNVITVLIDNYVPNITYEVTTPANKTTSDSEWVFINVTLNDAGDVGILEFNGTNYTMNKVGFSNYWYNVSLTGAYSGNYTYRVYANDTQGNSNVSVSRVITSKGKAILEGTTSLAPSQISSPSYNTTMLRFNLTAKGERINLTSVRVTKSGNYPYNFIIASLYWDSLGNTASSSNTTLQIDDILLAGPTAFTISEQITFSFSLMLNVSSPVTIMVVYDIDKIE